MQIFLFLLIKIPRWKIFKILILPYLIKSLIIGQAQQIWPCFLFISVYKWILDFGFWIISYKKWQILKILSYFGPRYFLKLKIIQNLKNAHPEIRRNFEARWKLEKINIFQNPFKNTLFNPILNDPNNCKVLELIFWAP